MLTLFLLVMFFAVFGRLFVFALKVGWGIFKIAAFLIFLPVIVLMMIFGGFVYIALPILFVVGIVGMLEMA